MTIAQTEANRRNALKSTGPVTPKGKLGASKNAMKHGILSAEVLIDGEKANDLAEFTAQMFDELAPVGVLESVLVDRIVSLLWRLKRAQRVESDVLKVRVHETIEDASGLCLGSEKKKAEHAAGSAFIRDEGRVFTTILRYETTIERGLFRTLHELQRLQAARLGQNVPVPAVIDVDVNVTQNEQ